MSARLSKVQALTRTYPWVEAPFIISAPMRVMAGAQLAVAVTRAGGLGFIGPGAKPEDTMRELQAAKKLLEEISIKTTGSNLPLMPIGIGFQTWNGDLKAASNATESYRPSAAWLFAPRHGQAELDDWTKAIRQASPETQVWIQVGTIREAVDAARSQHAPDILVIQGAEAGGHGRSTDGIGIITLLPEVQDALGDSQIPLFAAGGIADGRGASAALGLGASGVVMGTRFLASTEAHINKGYQDEVIRATDGASSTTRTHLYNHLRGTFNWPEQFSPRGIINASWRDHQAGLPFEELKKLHDELAAQGDKAWGPEGRVATYAGAGVGLVHEVKDAGTIVESIRNDASDIFRSLQSLYSSTSSVGEKI